MRIWLGIALAFLGATACGRTEEPPAPRTSVVVEPTSAPPAETAPQTDAAAKLATAPAGRTSAEASPPASPGCVVPWSKTPAAQVRPASDCPKAVLPAPALPHGAVVFRDAPGKPRIDVELAQTPPHRNLGLMFRTSLDEDAGMLFSWGDQEIRSFWMHNTCLPLDMMFVAADGTISGILEQVPPMNDETRSVGCRVQHVLEVNAGWSRRHGVAPGQHVDIEN